MVDTYMGAEQEEEECVHVSFSAKHEALEEYKAAYSSRHCIASVIEELAQGSRGARATRLFPIDGVKGLVDEKGDGT